MRKMILALLLTAGSVYGQVRDVIVPNYVTGGKDEPKVVFLQNQEYPEIYDILYSDTVDIYGNMDSVGWVVTQPTNFNWNSLNPPNPLFKGL